MSFVGIFKHAAVAPTILVVAVVGCLLGVVLLPYGLYVTVVEIKDDIG